MILVFVRILFPSIIGRLVQLFIGPLKVQSHHSRLWPERILLAKIEPQSFLLLPLIVHEDASFLEGSEFEIFSGFWVEFQ